MTDLRFSGTLDHFGIKCADLNTSIAEYQRMGFTIETVYHDWAMMRDPNGVGIALLPPDSKHPPHIGLKVASRQELESAAERENKPIKPHRDGTASFYIKGPDGNVIEIVHYPDDAS